MNVLILLFGFDFCWAWIAWAYTTDASRATLLRWLVSNVITAIVFIAVRVIVPADMAPWWIASLSVIRTILDYSINSRFYFLRAINEERKVAAS